MTKTYVAVVRDHSASMRSLVSAAKDDYNLTLDGLRESAGDQDITVTVVECGVGARATVEVKEQDVPVSAIKNLASYGANGSGTPLRDSVGMAIEQLEFAGRFDRNPTTAYLVMVITDGYENQSRHWSVQRLLAKINSLQASDKWTFVFRVPRGHSKDIQRVLGIPAGNIMEWEQTTQALETATTVHVNATQSYFKSRSAGKTSTGSFYQVNLADVREAVKNKEVKLVTNNYYSDVVPANYDQAQIRTFCEEVMGVAYVLGNARYQLTKRETVQDYKEIVIRDKSNGNLYAGSDARQLLGLPEIGTIKLGPTQSSKYEVFVQSNSVNRKVEAGTRVLYKK